VGLVWKVHRFLAAYVVMPEPVLLAVSAWVVASWLADLLDRFPHLAITSPEGRCGKTRLLELLEQVCRNAKLGVGSSAAALYRKIAAGQGDRTRLPTVLLDEAQSLNRCGSEGSEVLRELLCSAVGKNAVVSKCVGQDHEPFDFPVYCPKVITKIGKLDGVLADRCIPAPMKRKTKGDEVRRCRMREVESEGAALRDELRKWSGRPGVRAKVKEAYDRLDPFDIDNDRMAELLLPLQAAVEAAGDGEAVGMLQGYARGLEEMGGEADAVSPGVLLLAALRDIFGGDTPVTGRPKSPAKGWLALGADRIIFELIAREDEPWATYRRGSEPITREGLANLLRPYGIKSEFNKGRTGKLYYAARFEDAWERYLPAPPAPENLSDPSDPSDPSGPAG
jgi:hypothetical protein